jgi:protein NrfD
MIEITTTRANELVDPALHVWGWEVTAYLFVGGIVAGMMVLAGMNMLRVLSGRRLEEAYPVQTPLLALALLSLGMLALLMDLEHRLYVWALYITFEPLSPMSWGSWILLFVYPVLAVSALIRLPDAWPWLGARLRVLTNVSEWLVRRPDVIRVLAWSNIVLGIAVGIYTGILLSTMAARPLWNSAILGPLFLCSGLSAAAALMLLLSRVLPDEARQSALGGGLSALLQPLEGVRPDRNNAQSLARVDIVFLAIEIVLIALLLIGLVTASESQIAAAQLLVSGRYALVFWLGVIALGIVAPLVLELLEMNHKLPHSIAPAILVLIGGFALRWVLVEAGQASHILSAAAGF